jgi:hypothetical protein
MDSFFSKETFDDKDFLNETLFPYLEQDILDKLDCPVTTILHSSTNLNNNSISIFSPDISIKSKNEIDLIDCAIKNLCDIKSSDSDERNCEKLNSDNHTSNLEDENVSFNKLEKSTEDEETNLSIFFRKEIYFAINITIVTINEKEKLTEILSKPFNKEGFKLFLKHEVNLKFRLFISINNNQDNRSLIKGDGMCVLRCFYIVYKCNESRYIKTTAYRDEDVDMRNQEQSENFFEFLDSSLSFINKTYDASINLSESKQRVIEETKKKFEKVHRILNTYKKDKIWNKKKYLVLESFNQLDPDICRYLVTNDVNKRIFWWTESPYFFKESEKSGFCHKSSSAYFKKDNLTGEKMWVTSMDSLEEEYFSGGNNSPMDLNYDLLETRILDNRAHHFVLSKEHAFPAIIPYLSEDMLLENLFNELRKKLVR